MFFQSGKIAGLIGAIAASITYGTCKNSEKILNYKNVSVYGRITGFYRYNFSKRG